MLLAESTRLLIQDANEDNNGFSKVDMKC